MIECWHSAFELVSPKSTYERFWLVVLTDAFPFLPMSKDIAFNFLWSNMHVLFMIFFVRGRIYWKYQRNYKKYFTEIMLLTIKFACFMYDFLSLDIKFTKNIGVLTKKSVYFWSSKDLILAKLSIFLIIHYIWGLYTWFGGLKLDQKKIR